MRSGKRQKTFKNKIVGKIVKNVSHEQTTSYLIHWNEKNRYCLFLKSAENLTFQHILCFTEIDIFQTIFL